MTTPKARFQANEAAARWMRDVVDNKWFQEALEATQLTLQAKLADDDKLDAVAGYNQMLGIQKYVRELLKIADIPNKPIRQPSNDNLNPKA